MSIDYTGIPSPVCPNCSSGRFVTWIVVDPQDYEIGMYGINGKCYNCDTKYTIGTPIDSPDYIEMDMEND
jgi:hypothetical protein